MLTKERMMATDDHNFPALVKEVRKQLTLSQEDLANKPGISFATVNRWKNRKFQPSKPAKAH